ncbi:MULTISPECIES: hypothetical protein [unclassified Arthrobacter]|uniref:hypothetical protein n=1 Tax=unclassified Arthrobacter TaxID=235627 RepID=UPI001F18314C|nr:hypothetical protein [Arthrobacter sp. FW306-06-A]UKA70380.1 hypothetical protein LFT49_16815 [Arthrobacter sp. FW306-06-A]
MKNRAPLLATLALSLLLTGCAAAGSAGQALPAAPPGPAGSTAAAHAGHHGTDTAVPETSPGGPSAAARMVCGDQPMERLTSILSLDRKPHTVSSWANGTFTCTYHLTEGALVITVQEAPDQARARAYFDAMQALATDASPIEGLANLGFPAYETAAGSAVFQKDNFVLQVNASALPPAVGPDAITRGALAYQLSTTILACWVEHH